MTSTNPINRATLCAMASRRYDAANIAHRYACMMATTINVITKLHQAGDPLLGPMLDVAGWLTEDVEHCFASELDEAQLQMGKLGNEGLAS
ncbi:hypothetical protein [Chitiniphilus eburneus]|uniref:Uncharacterized protein n=1 Tax=Chitiniphilus eburneus TaxID=2571148 RepID=A0A4U0PNM3_9NEIS|nr:hypothetical protein [Chitiniphilus eburneus]TJZ69745.1 hypothetical protein FAZ21_14600 [Chitiniphilus eburneus]